MKIDVIIPIYKPGPELFTLLDKLEAQSVRAENIILMNTGKKYFEALIEGMAFADKYPNVKVYHLTKKEFDHGTTRRQAVGYCQGEVFVMMTQDAMPADPFLLERLVEGLSGTVAVAYARQLAGSDSSELEKVSRMFNYPEHSQVKTKADLKNMGIKTFFCSNVCAAYRRDVYEELGGFVGHTIFNEDMIYAAGAIRANYGVAYVAKARVVHSHNYTNICQLRRNFDLGVSQAQHPEVFGAVTSEAEGKRFVKAAWGYFKKGRQLYKFPGFCLQCGFKYAGYLLGKHYDRLPRSLVLRLTTNKEYWERHEKDTYT
jgi:rhamnosyltransferase